MVYNKVGRLVLSSNFWAHGDYHVCVVWACAWTSDTKSDPADTCHRTTTTFADWAVRGSLEAYGDRPGNWLGRGWCAWSFFCDHAPETQSWVQRCLPHCDKTYIASIPTWKKASVTTGCSWQQPTDVGFLYQQLILTGSTWKLQDRQEPL